MTESLLPEEYQAVVGPALKAAADLAAARGDPYLFNDLPSMLTLMVLVGDLADLYQDEFGALGQISPRSVFKAAPLAACVMVLSEYEVDADSTTLMSGALTDAHQRLMEDKIFGAERVQVQKAWQAIISSNHDLAAAQLRQAATITAAAVDAWEEMRNSN